MLSTLAKGLSPVYKDLIVYNNRKITRTIIFVLITNFNLDLNEITSTSLITAYNVIRLMIG